MSVIKYTAHARAPLIGGHSAGTAYSFEISFMAFEKAYNSPKKQHRALSGNTETVLMGINETIFITIGLYDSTDIAQIEEFIKSVAGGEAFSVDVDGTIAVPDTLIDVVLAGSSNTPARFGPRTYSLSFNVNVVGL